MQQAITGDDLFAELLMLRTADLRTIVLLEGPTDCQALDPHIDAAYAHTLPGYSKTAVERALELSDQHAVGRVLAVLDLDWVRLLEPALTSANVVYTDEYDLETTMLLAGDVLARVVSSTTDRDRVQQWRERSSASEEDRVIRIAGVVGAGRFVSCRDGLELNFRGFPVHAALTADEADVDINQLATIAIGRSTASKADQSGFVSVVRAELAKHRSLQRFCCGHDTAATLAHFIQRVWGGGAVSAKTVEQFLRAAFGCSNLQSTRLYTAVETWAASAGTTVWSCRTAVSP